MSATVHPHWAMGPCDGEGADQLAGTLNVTFLSDIWSMMVKVEWNRNSTPATRLASDKC